jgi:hypothetical protein
MNRYPLLVAACSTVLVGGQLQAQTTAARAAPDAPPVTGAETTRRALEALRIVGTRPVIDGLLDDDIWTAASFGTDFVQLQPTPGAPATERTEVRVAYDEAALYIAARMYDAQPDSIVAQLARRDQVVYSDWIFVAVDSYFDRRTAFVFAVNPRGVKADLMLFDDTRQDESWDAVWDATARIDSLGWTAEFRIPLSQLRFSAAVGPDREQTWGINFMRRIARRNEESYWAPLRRDADAVVSAFGDLSGLRGLGAPRRLEVQPYALSRVTRAPGDAANPFYSATAGRLDGGADLSFGVTSDLTLTATMNPDFGQVEADPAVVNLSAFESFFGERRPFFVEGADIFRFRLGMGDDNDEQLFYSRRIGRAPQGSLPGGTRWHDTPEAARILGAAKLSGKTGGWSVGFMNAMTDRAEARYATGDGSIDRHSVEPFTNYAVARVIRDFRDGGSAVGIMATATNRRLEEDHLLHLRRAAYTGGLTARHRFGQGRFQLSGWLAGSHINGDTLAIRLAQQAPARYYQRPDAPAGRFDPERTALSGWAGSIEIAKNGGGHWRWATALNGRSPGFEINDLGFQNSADEIVHGAYVGYDQFRPGSIFRRWRINLNQWNGWTFDGTHIAAGGNINGNFELPSFWGGALGFNHDRPQLSRHALRGGPALRTFARSNVWFHTYSDRRTPINASLNGNYAFEQETGGRSYAVSPTLRIRASSRAELSLSPRYAVNRAAWQYVARRTVADQPYYVFAELDQTTASLTARLSYTFTPTLSLQFYAQPFISAGAYGGFMEVADPRGAGFDQRFRRYDADAVDWDGAAREYGIDRNGNGAADFMLPDPNFNVKQLRTNTVLRWEYRPGSTLFLVWSQGRSQRDATGSFDFGRDLGDLWSLPATNVLLLKVNYWLGL